MAYQFFSNEEASISEYMMVDVGLLFDLVIPHEVKMAYFALQHNPFFRDKHENAVQLLIQTIMPISNGQARRLLGELVRWGLLTREETQYKGVFSYKLVNFNEYEPNKIYNEAEARIKRKSQKRKENAKFK